MSAVTDFAAAVQIQFDVVNTALDNIAVDETNLAKQIQDLKDQIAVGGSVLTPEDQAALNLVVTNATALATKTKTTADAVPDLPVVPAG